MQPALKRQRLLVNIQGHVTAQRYGAAVLSTPAVAEVYELCVSRQLVLPNTSAAVAAAWFMGYAMKALIQTFGFKPWVAWLVELAALGGLAIGDRPLVPGHHAEAILSLALHFQPWKCIKLSRDALHGKLVPYPGGASFVDGKPVHFRIRFKDIKGYTYVLLSLPRKTWKAFVKQRDEQAPLPPAERYELTIPLSHLCLLHSYGAKPAFAHTHKLIATHFFCDHAADADGAPGKGRACGTCGNAFHVNWGSRRTNSWERLAHTRADEVVVPRMLIHRVCHQPPDASVFLHPSRRP